MRKISIWAGLFFGISMSICDLCRTEYFTTKSIIRITLMGIMSGILFGYLFWKFYKSVKFNVSIEIEADENIIHESGASCKTVGGKLFLTNKRLIFKSHKFNIQNHEFSMNLDEIVKVNRYRNIGIINNGVSILCKNDKTEKLIVEEPEKWIETLDSIISIKTS